MNSNEFDKKGNVDQSTEVNPVSADNTLNTEGMNGTDTLGQRYQAESTQSADETAIRSTQLEINDQTDRIPEGNSAAHPTLGPVGAYAEEYAGDTQLKWEGLYAGFWMRFWAYLLDLVVIGSVNRMVINPVFRALDVSLVEDGIFSPASIATAVVFYLYFVLMTKYYGQTLGKMVFGLRVVELKGKQLSWGTVIFREWIGRFISATVMVLYVVVAFSKKKQGLHDMFADTAVIYETR
jgi:uncharacterized RDD family membrane protein YckC